MTKTKNVYLVVVVDLIANAVHGHHLLDLNEQYGLTTQVTMTDTEKPSTIECDTHGTRTPCCICCHLNRATDMTLGFVENSSDSEDLQAWCDECEQRFVREQEMTPAFRAFTDMCIVCDACYVQGPSVRSVASPAASLGALSMHATKSRHVDAVPQRASRRVKPAPRESVCVGLSKIAFLNELRRHSRFASRSLG